MEELIHIKSDGITLEGMLKIPPQAHGIVLFAHGSGSSRHSPRNNFVATVLNQGQLGTLLIDLLSEDEDEVYQTRFDIDLLTERLVQVLNWLKSEKRTTHLPVGLFGSSTGAAAALSVAAAAGKDVKAVVSRGGRPDLAKERLQVVVSPTLLIVGGNDWGVIELNEWALEQLHCTKDLQIVSGATHLFEEPGTLEMVAKLAKDWFSKYLKSKE